MKTKTYKGEVLVIQSCGGKRRGTLNLGNFFPANTKDIKKVMEMIRDLVEDSGDQTAAVMTMIDWLKRAIKETKEYADQCEAETTRYFEKACENSFYENAADSSKKLRVKAEKQVERYRKNIDDLKTAAEKCHIHLDGV